VKLFADDTKLFGIVSTPEEFHQLKDDLQQTMSWSESWEMSFNPSKCSVLHLGSTNSHNEYSFLYREEAVNLKHSEEVKDLGVTIDARLEFSSRINNIVSKANRQLGLLKRSFKIWDAASIIIILLSYTEYK